MRKTYRLSDLKDHLFAGLERLRDETLTPEQIAAEAKRADAVVALVDQAIDIDRVTLAACKLYAEHGDKLLPMLPQIGKATS